VNTDVKGSNNLYYRSTAANGGRSRFACHRIDRLLTS